MDEYQINKIKKERKIFFIIVPLILLVALIGITFAFFNYTRTGSGNTIRVGRISFVSKNEQTITLNNLFPIDPSNSTDMNDATKVGTYSIDIEGDTDYSGGIEYLVSITDANIFTSTGKTVPISINVTVDSLGTSDTDYFVNRDSTNVSIYKKLVGDSLVGDQMLLIGYIPPNDPTGTPDGVDGSITIKAYLDKNKILISDTYDGTESDNMGTTNQDAEGKTVLTTTEWNSIQSSGVSFKVKVEANEGIWVTGSLEEIMKTKNYSETLGRGIRDDESSPFVTAQTGINFGAISSDTNGKGVYMRAGTQNATYPILYYRGDVTDNNVVFNNKCWKAVRTTDTGGVKLVYNGELVPIYDYSTGIPLSENEYTIIQDDYGFTYNQNDKAFVTTMQSGDYDLGEFGFSVPNGSNYFAKIEITGNHEYDDGYYDFAIDSNFQHDYVNSYPYEKYWPLGTLTSSNIIAFYDELYDAYYGPLTIKIQVLKNVQITVLGCNNIGVDSQISISGTKEFAFNTSSNSPAYNGYMWGTVYESKIGSKNGIYWSDVQYNENVYELKTSGTTSESLNSTHHYICEDSSNCTKLRYYYLNDYYIELENGDTVESALEKMQTNTTSSNAKTKIDTWYASQMNTVTNKLEDTIWCNDRTIGIDSNSGWIANGGGLYTGLYYGAYQRSNSAINSSTVQNQPSLVCTNKNDAFTVSNAQGNRKLTYPVALLTEDEMVLAGGVASSDGTFYLNNGSAYNWSMSPSVFNNTSAGEFSLNGGNIISYSVNGIVSTNVSSTRGIRPAISIKPGQLVTKGTGTVTDPYIIE